jgi:predicted RNA-binding protein with PUA-like domain
MKLWLVPASDAPATANLPKTLSQPISNERKQRAGLADNYQHAWGARSGVKNDVTLEKLDRGDLCLFYTADSDRKQYNWAAEVAEVRESPELSQALWDTPEFKWVYFLRNLRRIDLPVGRLSRAFAKYRENYFQHAPKGIISVDPNVVDGLVRDHGSIEDWLSSILENQLPELTDFLAIARRYHIDRTVFQSSVQAARYAIAAVDDRGCDVRRLDAEENARCTITLLAEKLDLVRRNGGRCVFDSSFGSTSAVRNCFLQSPNLALSADRRDILDVSESEKAINLFCEILRSLRVDESSGTPKLYKPAMVACVLDGIADGTLPANKISFEWVASRFISKMKELGEEVGEREAAMPFYHLTGDLFWLLSYNDLERLVSGGNEGPSAIKEKVSHASLKDTFWEVLQNEEYRQRAANALAERWWPSNHTPRFWVEKTIVKGRPDRQEGDNALGRALWSPQTADGGRRIYAAMLDVRPGDIVFHFVDNERLDSFSTVASSADSSFIGIKGTEWADRPAYRIALTNHQKLVPSIERKDFLEDERYRPAIEDLLATKKGLFFNREFNLNQGSYITEAPLTLVSIWNDIFKRKAGTPIQQDWHLSSPILSKTPHHSYWIFQANPEKFDIDTYVRGRTDIRCSVRQHKDAIHIGDVVLMWRSGSNSGVVAECIVTSEPSEQIGEDAPELRHGDPGADKDVLRCTLRVKEAFPDRPISRESISAAVPGLGIFKFSQATNFPLTEEEYEAITELRDVAPLDKSQVRYWKVAPGRNAALARMSRRRVYRNRMGGARRHVATDPRGIRGAPR